MTAPAAPTLSPMCLPRAGALTEALLGDGATPSTDAVASARRDLEHGLTDAAGRSGARPCLRVRAFDLVTAAGGGSSAATPFRWTTRTARRRVGLAALRACLSEPGMVPAEAVALVVADPAAPSGPGPAGPGSCSDWLCSLSPPARAAVQAESTAWATAVWTSLEWDRVQPAPVVGAPDRWWDWRGPVRVALQGRADVRVPGPGGAHLVVLDGYPSAASRQALCFGPLVDALRSNGAATPARVVAWWPECGKAWVQQVDGAGLRACAGQVVRVVRLALDATERAG